MTDAIHRIHIPCPNCGFCNHLYTGDELPETAPAEDDDSCEDIFIFDLTPEDVEPMSKANVRCANCNSVVVIGIFISVALTVQDEMPNAPSTGTLQ